MELTAVQIGGGEMRTTHHTDRVIIHRFELSSFDLPLDRQSSYLLEMTARGHVWILFIDPFVDHRGLLRCSSFPQASEGLSQGFLQRPSASDHGLTRG